MEDKKPKKKLEKHSMVRRSQLKATKPIIGQKKNKKINKSKKKRVSFNLPPSNARESNELPRPGPSREPEEPTLSPARETESSGTSSAVPGASDSINSGGFSSTQSVNRPVPLYNIANPLPRFGFLPWQASLPFTTPRIPPMLIPPLVPQPRIPAGIIRLSYFNFRRPLYRTPNRQDGTSQSPSNNLQDTSSSSELPSRSYNFVGPSYINPNNLPQRPRPLFYRTLFFPHLAPGIPPNHHAQRSDYQETPPPSTMSESEED
nr:uncharacterized protein LOC106677174 [Halyomorpha halys]